MFNFSTICISTHRPIAPATYHIIMTRTYTIMNMRSTYFMPTHAVQQLRDSHTKFGLG